MDLTFIGLTFTMFGLFWFLFSLLEFLSFGRKITTYRVFSFVASLVIFCIPFSYYSSLQYEKIGTEKVFIENNIAYITFDKPNGLQTKVDVNKVFKRNFLGGEEIIIKKNVNPNIFYTTIILETK